MPLKSDRPSTRRSSSSRPTVRRRSRSTTISTGSTAASPTASPRAAATTWRFERSGPREAWDSRTSSTSTRSPALWWGRSRSPTTPRARLHQSRSATPAPARSARMTITRRGTWTIGSLRPGQERPSSSTSTPPRSDYSSTRSSPSMRATARHSSRSTTTRTEPTVASSTRSSRRGRTTRPSPMLPAVATRSRTRSTFARSLRGYSSTGQFEARFDAISVGGSGPGPLAIAPSGEPHFSQGTEIWKLANGELRRVLRGAFIIWAFAFDVAGNIYAPAPAAGRIQLFDATGAIVADTFAIGPDAPQAVAFGRDATGATVARLFATDPRVGRVFEVNPAGVAHPGQPVGYVAPRFPLDVAAASLLGGGGLSAADLQYLDALGNHNGRYDVGDLQAYLRTVGALPGARSNR